MRRRNNKQYSEFIRHEGSLFKVFLEDRIEPSELYPELPTYKGGSLNGQIGRCGRVINMASGGLYDSTALKEAQDNNNLNGTKEFTVEVWQKEQNGHYLKHIQDVTYGGCKWHTAMHEGDCSCCCGGFAQFEYETKVVTDRNNEECIIPAEEKYLSIDAVKHIEKYRKTII